MFEYAISAGEGTLIDYGMCNGMDLLALIPFDASMTIVIRPASPDCATGQ